MAKPCQNNQRLTVQFKTFQNMSNSSWSLKFMQKQYLLSIIYIYICVTNKFRMKTTMQEVVESVCFLSESIEVFPPGGHGVPRPVLVGASSLQHIGRSWSMAALINSNGNSRLWPRVFFIALGRFLESWDTASVSNKGYGAVSKLFRTPPSSLLPSNKAHSVAWGSVCGRMHGLVSTLLLSCSLTSVFPTPRNF